MASHHPPGASDGHVEIVDAAARVLARRGPMLTMDEVALEAGVSRATVYRAFPSKTALLRAVDEAGHGIPQEESADARARLLEAVDRVLLRHGLAGLTVEAIAEAAGSSPATLYRHFGDRAGLLRAYAEEKSPRRAARKLALDDDADLEPALKVFALAALRALSSSRAVFRMLFAQPEEGRRMMAEVRDAPRGTVAALARWLSAQMERGRVRREDPLLLAHAFVGQLIMFAVLLEDTVSEGPPPEEVAATLARTFVRGIRS